MSRRAAVIGCAIALTALGACEPPDPAPRFKPAGQTVPRNGGTLRFATHNELGTMDPSAGYDEVTYIVLHALFDTLIDYSPDARAHVPRLARSWTTSPDGRVYRFELRRDIRFPDGTPITAAHFKYSLERAISIESTTFGPWLADIEGADAMLSEHAASCTGIAAEDDQTLIITLARSNAALLNILSLPFATPQRREHVAAAGAELFGTPDATGPYKLARWDRGNRIVLERNPRYYDARRAHLDQIVILENVPRDTQFLMFERGELESADVAAPDYLFVAGQPAWQPYIHLSVGLNAFGSRMNVQKKPFDNPLVRQALNYAVDKRHSARLFHGTTLPAHGILPPGLPGYDPDLAPYPHDVAKARSLLAQAGYPRGFDVEYVTQNDEETENIAGSLQSDLAEAGVRVHLAVMSFATYSETIKSADGSAFSLATWYADYLDPGNFFEPFHGHSITRTKSVNDTSYDNPVVNRLLDEARGEPEPARRAALYRQVERILYDDAPWIWDYHRQTTELTQPYVRNYQPHPIWLRDYISAWLDVGSDGAPVPR